MLIVNDDRVCPKCGAYGNNDYCANGHLVKEWICSLEFDAIKELKGLQRSDDREEAHVKADCIILRFCRKEIREEYEKIEKWYA